MEAVEEAAAEEAVAEGAEAVEVAAADQGAVAEEEVEAVAAAVLQGHRDRSRSPSL